MKIAIVGAGAMGSLFGSMLSAANEVTLIDVHEPTVRAIQTDGLRVADREGNERTVPLRAVTTAAEAGAVDLVILFVKCYHTETAARGMTPLLDENTIVLSLQNGWGNAPKLQNIVGAERVMAGVTYHSATVLAPGKIQHAASGRTVIGELTATNDHRLERVMDALRNAGIQIETAQDIRREIWSKLALNVCTLPAAALLQFYAGELIQHQGTLDLMRALLMEVVAVAHAQGIAMDYDERWSAITGLLERAKTARGSMVQDVQAKRRTEIDVINGAIVHAGKQFHIPTPYNNSMVWMVKALEETF